MSGPVHGHHEAQGGHGTHGAHDAHGGAGHGTFRGYVTGFVLAALLTAVPFALVMGDMLGNARLTAFIVMAFAVVQIVVHMVYFLHMNTQSEGGWNMLALIFTVVLVVITIAGSLWVMYHLNTNMMLMDGHAPGALSAPADPSGPGGQGAAPAGGHGAVHAGHAMGQMP